MPNSSTASTLHRPLSRRRAWQAAGLLIACVAVLMPTPSRADILVMTDGSRVETAGVWQIKGSQVTFTSKTGTLSAVRLSEVDLDESRAATEAALRGPETPAPQSASAPSKPAQAAVLTLTNDDIAPGEADVGDIAIDARGDGSAVTDEGLAVSSWSYEPGGGDPAYELIGQLTNQTGVQVENIVLYVDFVAVDDTGAPLPNYHFLRQARVIDTALEPGEATSFRYPVSPQDLQFSGAAELFEDPRVSFDVQFRRVATVPTTGGDLQEPDDVAGEIEILVEDDEIALEGAESEGG